MQQLIKNAILKIVFDKDLSVNQMAKKLYKIFSKFDNAEMPDLDGPFEPISEFKLVSFINIAHGQAFGKMEPSLGVNVFDRIINSMVIAIEHARNKAIVKSIFKS